MNDYHSRQNYKKRWLATQLRDAIKNFPVIVLTGARQVGKSTFLQNELADFSYISLDDFSILRQAKADPSSLWLQSDRVIVDEAQKAPEVFSAVKLSVDRSKRRVRFVISGSSNLLLMKDIKETLAGRAVYFDMFPLTYSESANAAETIERFLALWETDYKPAVPDSEILDPIPFILKGFMPPLISLTERKDILLWWEGYVRTYLERDIRELSQIEPLIDFKRVLDSLAVRTANVLNQTEVARDTGVSQPTVYRYVKLLEVSNIIKRVPAYYKNRSKRITKSPKILFIDPGLSAYLSGYHDENSLRNARETGHFFETMLYLHLRVLCELLVPKANIFYWRTTTGKEVDFILEHGRKLLAIEVKLTKNPSFSDVKNLISFIEDNPETVRGILVHAGDSIKWLHSKILAVPWWWIC